MSRFAEAGTYQDRGEVRDIRWFGARGDGSFDNRRVLLDAVLGTAVADSAWSVDASRLHGASALHIPRGTYYVSAGDAISVAGNKGIAFIAEAPGAVRFVVDGGGDLFTLESGWAPKLFRGIIFDQANIALEGGFRGGFYAEYCTWDQSTDYAVRTSGESVVKAKFTECMFNRCNGAISVGHAACDLWLIDHCYIVRCKREGLAIKSSGVDCRFTNFENKFDAAARAYPHVTIEPDDEDFDGGLSRLFYNRFGSEVGTGGGPPEYNVRLGPSSATTGTMSGITMRDNHHGRRNGGPLAADENDPGSSIAAVYITKDVHSTLIDDWFQADTYTFGTALVLNASSGGSPETNILRARVNETALDTVPKFSGTSTGWTVE